ncbi:hypothetical protein HDU92_006388 [Lobulomyces angularis]|nr:hypothetical protein HDU92_006388 [Lobulomyces angularis]
MSHLLTNLQFTEGLNLAFEKVLLPNINNLLSNIIVNSKLDPILVLAEDKVSTSINFGLVEPNLNATYKLSNVKGLSKIKLTELQILECKMCEVQNDICILKCKGGMNKIDISVEIKGNANTKVGLNLPEASLSGKVESLGITSNFLATAKLKTITGFLFNSYEITEVTIDSINCDFKNVNVYVDGLVGIFNPLVNWILTLIENVFKKSLTSVICFAFKNDIQKTISSLLPIPIEFQIPTINSAYNGALSAYHLINLARTVEKI